MTAGSSDGAPAPPSKEAPWKRLATRQYLIGGSVAVAVLLIFGGGIRYHRGSDQRRYESLLKSSLDRLVTAQEGFYYDSTRYTSTLRSLPSVHLPPGVQVRIFNPDSKSWWGVATHDQLRGRHCIVWVGSPPSSLPADARSPEDETKPLCFDDGHTVARRGS